MLIPLKDINPTQRMPFATWVLVGVNVVVFFYQFFVVGLEQSIFQGGLIPARLLGFGQVSYEGSLHPYAVTSNPVATLFSSMFMHGGFLHLAGNMLYLWIFGNNVEDRLGSVRFALFYLLGGVLAALTHILAATTFSQASLASPMVGASGAVAAVLGGYLLLFPGARVRCLLFLFLFMTFIELPAILVLGWWILIQVLNGFMGAGLGSGGVAWFAHIGGFFAGFLILYLFGYRRRQVPSSYLP